MAEGFLESVLGVHDVRLNGGSLLPRRHVVHFANGDVDDIGGEIVISVVQRPLWGATIALGTDEDDHTQANIGLLTDIAFSCAAPGGDQYLTGVDATNELVLIKRVWNLGADTDENLIIGHDDSGSLAANRIYTPGGVDMSITPGSAALLVRHTVSNYWRALPCLV